MNASNHPNVLIAMLVTILASASSGPISTAAEEKTSKKDKANANAKPPAFIPPDFATTSTIVGHWTLDGNTVLKHDLKMCGKKEIGEDLEKELLPLATRLGSRYTLLIQSDGLWKFSSFYDGRIDDLEDEIFAKLTGKEVPKGFDYDKLSKRFPNDPKRPLGGSWRWSEADGFTHFGFKEQHPHKEGYPVKGPGKIVVGKGTLEITDAESGEVMGFTFVRKYRHDPDPRFRGPALDKSPVRKE